MSAVPPWIRALLYVMIVGGSFVSLLVAGRAVWLHRTIEAFSGIEGTVSTSEVRSYDDGDREQLVLVADYEVDGQGYQANAWMGVEGADDLSDAELVAAHPVGSPITVWYDPKHPDHATLSRDVQVLPPILTALVLVIFTGFVLTKLRQVAAAAKR